ncbi:MAG: pectate lyase [Planctomycetaceae bacterium]|nr:pectate lyase [Planctomycetaceae bacterium]
MALLVVGTLAASAAPVCAEIAVDLSLTSRRKDTRTPGWHTWEVADGPSATATFDGVEITLTAKNGDLKGDWYKPGLVTGATLLTDGVVVVDGSGPRVLEMTIAGLPAGRHTLVTYHNALGEAPQPPLKVTVDDGPPATVQPTVRAADNDTGASAFLEFAATDDQPVIVRIASTGSDESAAVVLNGFEIDAPDPQKQARRPQPVDRDWHADVDSGLIALSWEPPADAVEQQVHVAMDESPEAALAELETSRGFAAKLTDDRAAFTFDPAVPPEQLSQSHVRWRVDSVDADGKVTRGDVWAFRPRHLAFPGAEGYGRFAIGGRGGQVLHVTTLADSGPGSLRAAVEAEGPRTVVFDVSGRIVLADRLVIRNPYLTIAGQSAPGKGVCISNYNLGMLGAHDVIIRDIRVRPGDTAGKTLDGMGMASSDHAIIDHCSISWTQDEAFSSRGAGNITLQRTLISEALNVAGHKKYKPGTEHGYAASIGGDIGSFHHNLLAHCAGRNWSLAGGVDQASVHSGRLDVRNNVVYNWAHRTTDGGAKEVNFVNNYYKPGPASRVFHVLMPQHENPFGPQRYYMDGNVMEGRYGADERYAGLRESRNKQWDEYIVDEPFFPSHVTTTSAEAAYEDVLSDVGCNVPTLDEHDRRVIQEVREGGFAYSGSVSGLPGLPDSQEDVGGWEEYPEVHRPTDWDSDGDGLPGEWERAHGLNPYSQLGDLSDAHGDANGDGYTNLEEYLNELAQ